MLEPYAFQDAFGQALDLDGSPPSPFMDPAIVRALTVHRNTAANAAQAALAANYPVVRALVGDDSFAGCAAMYSKAEPPQDPRLCLYGEGLSNFLRTYTPFAELPYLADVAGLERFYNESLFAADGAALDGAAFASGIDPDLRLALHPATRFGAFERPAVSLWLAHQDTAQGDALDALQWHGEIGLVTRPGAKVRVMSIDSGAALFLGACNAGRSITDAAEAAATAGADVSAMFATLLSAGAFQSTNALGGAR